MTIPKNYRRVKSNERIRAEDLYVGRNSATVYKITNDPPRRTASYYSEYTFWRKRKKEPVSKSNAVNSKGLPLVAFTYTNKGQVTWRTVKVTKATYNYLEGFEQTGGNPFKRFLREKTEGIHLLTFNS
jgi:hypothetical protein